MIKIKFAVFLVLTFTTFAFSQSSEKRKQFEIDICRPEITEAGRQSSFHFNYIYRVTTDTKGSVKTVNELLDHRKYKSLMNDEKVIPCIKEWKLKPSENYIVTISVGTTGGENFLNISSKTVKMKIIL